MEFLVLLFSLFYVVFVLIITYQNTQLKSFKDTNQKLHAVKIAVIIPVRNEADNILNLLQDFENQSFDKSFFEIFVIDDFSTDQTFELVEDFAQKSNLNLNVFKLNQKNTISPKKSAITQAVNLTNAELILTTDGDSRVSRKHLQTFHDFYLITQKPKFISAPVCFFSPKSFLEKILFVEFSSLIATGSALIRFGKPSLCNGANLAFQKAAFLAVNGYQDFDQVPSGDDEFLLKKIAQKYPDQIQFLKSKNATVQTQPPDNLLSFYFQRKRWASKWKLHKGISVKILALFIFSFHLLNLGSGIGIVFGWFENPVWIIGHFLLKFSVECVFLMPSLIFFKQRKLFLYIIILQFIYSLYAVFFGVLANIGGYQWKDRRFH